MKKYFFNYSTLLFLLVFTGFGVLATSSFLPAIKEGQLNVSGRIKTEGKKGIDSVKIVIKDSTGRKQIGEDIYTDAKGRFKYNLDYNQKVKVYYSKEGFVEMHNTFNTNVPQSKKYKILYFDAAITMLSDSAEYNKRAIARTPFMEVAFNEGFDMFIESLDESIAFIENITQPNLGTVFISGQIQDSLQDSVNVELMAKDTLGFIVASTETEPDGRYELEVPLMSKLRLEFISDDHHPAFAEINTAVDTASNQDDFNMEQDFNLINKKVKDVNPEAFAIPIAQISSDPKSGSFAANPAVVQQYEESLWAKRNRMTLAGTLYNVDSITPKSTLIQVMDGDLLADEYQLIDTNQFEVPLPNDAIVHVKIKTKGFHSSFISINTNANKAFKDSVNIFKTNIELYSRDRTDVNPKAFKLPMSKFYFDENLGQFVADSTITKEFDVKLAEGVEIDSTANKGLITIECQVIDAISAQNVGKTKVRVLNENKRVVSVINTDKNGKLVAHLGTNKIYYLELESDGYTRTLNEFNTQVPEGYVNKNQTTNPFLRILHKDTEFGGKKVHPNVSDSVPLTLFFFDAEQDHFSEDFSYMTTFERTVESYVPPEPTKTGKELAAEQKANKEALMAEARAAVAAAAAAAAKAQEQNKLKISGTIVDESKSPLPDYAVELNEDNKTIAETKTNSKGEFMVMAPYNKSLQLKFDSKNHHSMFMNVSTTLPEGKKEAPDSLNMNRVMVYNKASKKINPKAFTLPAQSIAYENNGFKAKDLVSKAFDEALESTPDEQLLVVEGRIRDGENKTIGNADILIYNRGKVIDTVHVDRRGRFTTKLEYQKDYRLTVRKDGYYQTTTAMSTKSVSSSTALINKRIKNMKLLLVNKADSNINPSVFNRPFTRYAFDPNSGEFEEVTGVRESFMADLYLDKPEKKEYQLSAEKVSSEKNEGKKGFNDDVVAAGSMEAIAAANKRKQNENQAKKAEMMQSFHSALAGMSTPSRKKIKDVNLALQRIINTGYETRQKEEKELDESMLQAVQQMTYLNELIAAALGFKRSEELVSSDSTFNVNIPQRRYHYEGGKQIYKVYRDRVLSNDKKTEYVKVLQWWWYDTYYKNGKKIDKSHYENEMARVRKNSYLMN